MIGLISSGGKEVVKLAVDLPVLIDEPTCLRVLDKIAVKSMIRPDERIEIPKRLQPYFHEDRCRRGRCLFLRGECQPPAMKQLARTLLLFPSDFRLCIDYEVRSLISRLIAAGHQLYLVAFGIGNGVDLKDWPTPDDFAKIGGLEDLFCGYGTDYTHCNLMRQLGIDENGRILTKEALKKWL